MAGAARSVRTFGGVEVVVRPIEPSDRDALRRGFERMSSESRYRRFLAPVATLSESQLTYLTEVDHHDHEGLVAETADGEPVGVARFVRLPDDPSAAEAAVAVADDWHGRGVGTALTEELARRAREEGVETFTATALAANADVIDMLGRLGNTKVEHDAAGVVEMRIALADGTARGTPLHQTLKSHARGDLERHHAPGDAPA